MLGASFAMFPPSEPRGLEAKLNEPQAEAVSHVDGPLIVFAGAGSGKTRVITYRIASLVLRHRVPPYAILAVTFTNKAAGEMRHRLEGLLGPDLTRQLWIGTFHAVCVRLLRRYHARAGLGEKFVIYDDADQKALMKRIMKDLNLDDRRFSPQQLLGRIHSEKQEGRGPDEMSTSSYVDQVVHRCFLEYQRRLASANALDFEDILLFALRVAESASPEGDDLRERFRHVLVDEFQDTNVVQYRFVRALSKSRRNICVVGDDDQSIYRWRGADIRNIRGFTTDYPDARLIKLEQNYRSSSNIVEAALGVIKPSRERQPKQLWTANEAGEPVSIVHCANERDEAGYVVESVRAALAEGASARDLAVFFRIHAQSRILEEAMRAEGIPYQIVGGTRFFDRTEVKDLLAYLRLVVNPRSDVDLLRIINVPARKIGAKSIDRLAAMAEAQGSPTFDAIPALCRAADTPKAARHALVAFHEMIASFARAAATAPPRSLAEEVLRESGYGEWLKVQDTTEADARLDNIHELMGSIADYEEDARNAGEVATLEEYLVRITLQAAADTLEELPRVPMMTVHAAKGLEFEQVWITGLEEQLFPLRGQNFDEADDLEEERRLAYVAVTRARRRLHMTHANTRMLYGRLRYCEPSRFLFDLPAESQRRVATRALAELSRSHGAFGTFGSAGARPRLGDERRAARAFHDDDLDPDLAAPRTLGRAPARPVGSGPAGSTRPLGERFIERDDDVDASDHDGEAPPVRKGAQVRHSKFGIGTVLAVTGGSDPTVTVRFPGTGPKQIKLSFLSPH
ncbi:MAG: UvrD-helicase domain-containing protein [Deltaproteobacteria bacterium]|nr:UvrD-helicase domain-containing protein [Deltaproteobacteria bacterium]